VTSCYSLYPNLSYTNQVAAAVTVTRSDVRGIAFCVCWFAFILGCDGVPESMPPKGPELPSNVVGGTQHREYVWRTTAASPTQFNFPKRIDARIVQQKLAARVFESKRIQERPEWASDDLWRAINRLLEPKREPQELLELDDTQTNRASDVCIDPQLPRIWSVSDQIVEWNLESKLSVRSFPTPIKKPSNAFYESITNSLLIHNDEAIVRVSIEDGSVLNQWKSADGKIVRVAVARNTGLVGVVTSKNQLFALTNGLQKVDKCGEFVLANPNISIHPDGDVILAVTHKGMLKWYQRNESSSFIEVAEERLQKELTIPICGSIFDVWVDPNRAISLLRNSADEERPTVDMHVVFPVISQAVNATRNGTQDWVVALVHKLDEHKKVATYLQDFAFDNLRLECSESWKIPFESFEWLGGDLNCQRIAIRVGSKIKILERQVFRDPYGRSILFPLGKLLANGEPELFEKVVLELLPTDSDELGRTRDELLMLYIQNGVSQWPASNSQTDTRAREKLENWLGSGSGIATLCSVRRSIDLAFGASRTNVRESLNHLEHATNELKRIGTASEYSTVADVLACVMGVCRSKMGGLDKQSADQQEERMLRAIMANPFFSSPMTQLSMELVNLQKPKEIGAVLYAVAEQMPESFADTWYAQNCLFFSARWSPYYYFNNDYELVLSRIATGAMPLLRSVHLSRGQAEELIMASLSANRIDLAEEYASYAIRNFGIAGPTGCTVAEKMLIDTKRKQFPASFQHNGKRVFP